MTDPDVSWREAALVEMLRDDAIANSGYGLVGAAGEMVAQCIGIGDDTIRAAVTATTTYIYTRGTGSTTAGRDLILAGTLCAHIDA